MKKGLQSKDLRIGCQYQLCDGVLGGGIAKLNNKRDLDIAFDLLESKSIEPIILNCEILNKLGFERIVYDSEFTGFGEEYIMKVNNDIFMSFSDDFSLALFPNKETMDDYLGVLPTHKQTIYLHQLQNLYFALTGEELELRNETNNF